MYVKNNVKNVEIGKIGEKRRDYGLEEFVNY